MMRANIDGVSTAMRFLLIGAGGLKGRIVTRL